VDREQIEALLRELASELDRLGLRGELLVVGGAAMALAYSTRRVTADIDALFEPKQVIYDIARKVGERHGLDPGWLNDAVKAYVPGPDPNATVYFDLPGLVVRIASPRFMLAMKLLASRVERDSDDIRLLLRLSNITQVAEALDLVSDFYPSSTIPPRVELLVTELLAEQSSAG
jgi:hypothetical protein